MTTLENKQEAPMLNVDSQDLQAVSQKDDALNGTMDMLSGHDRDKEGKDAYSAIKDVNKLIKSMENAIANAERNGIDCSLLKTQLIDVRRHKDLMEDAFKKLTKKGVLMPWDGSFSYDFLASSTQSEFDDLNRKVSKYKTYVRKSNIEQDIVDLNKAVEEKKASEAEEARKQAEEAQRQAEEARRQAEDEASRQRNARKKAEKEAEEARRQAEEAQRQAEEARRQAEEMAQQNKKDDGTDDLNDVVDNTEKETVDGLVDKLKDLLVNDLEYKGQIKIDNEYYTDNKVSYSEKNHLKTIHVEGKNITTGSRVNYDLNYSLDKDGYPVLFKDNKKGADKPIDSRKQLESLNKIITRAEIIKQAMDDDARLQAMNATGQVDEEF